MGIVGRATRDEPATTIAPVESASDPEKAEIKAEGNSDGSRSPAGATVAPAVEKRVVRKLDKHLTPLVAFLCTSRITILTAVRSPQLQFSCHSLTVRILGKSLATLIQDMH